MKIAHLTSGHSPVDTRIFIKQCQSLAKAGFEVTIVHPGNSYAESINGVRFLGTGISPRGRWDRILKIPKNIYHTACDLDADVYHFHDPALIPYGLKLKRKGKVVIYDAHEDVPRQTLNKDYLSKSIRPLLAWFLEKYENKAARKFDFVVAATPTIERRFQNIGAKSTVVANYPLLAEFQASSSQKRHPKTVVYIGIMARIRGFREMIRAVSILPDARLLLAGPRPSTELVSEVSSLPGWNRTELLGELGRPEIKDLLSTSAVGLVVLHPTSNYLDAFPIKMFEYMAAGIPVIASNFPIWKEIVEGSRCGICVDPMDPEAIAKAIRFIFDNPDKAAEMGKRGQLAVANKFNWETEQEKLFKVYNSIKP